MFLKKGARKPVYILTEEEYKELDGCYKRLYDTSEELRLKEKLATIEVENKLRNQIQDLERTIAHQDDKITLLYAEIDELKLANDELNLRNDSDSSSKK